MSVKNLWNSAEQQYKAEERKEEKLCPQHIMAGITHLSILPCTTCPPLLITPTLSPLFSFIYRCPCPLSLPPSLLPHSPSLLFLNHTLLLCIITYRFYWVLIFSFFTNGFSRVLLFVCILMLWNTILPSSFFSFYFYSSSSLHPTLQIDRSTSLRFLITRPDIGEFLAIKW